MSKCPAGSAHRTASGPAVVPGHAARRDPGAQGDAAEAAGAGGARPGALPGLGRRAGVLRGQLAVVRPDPADDAAQHRAR